MTTILDNIKSPDVISPVKQGFIDVDIESSGKTKFADIIEQANIKNEINNSEENSDKSAANKKIIAVNTESNELGEVLAVTIESEVESAIIIPLLPNAQSKITLNAVNGYAPKEANSLKHTPGIKLQTQVTLDTAISTGSGNKLPGEGQIQPVPPSQSLSNIETAQAFPEGFKFKNPNVQKEFESKAENTKIVNLNPVKASKIETPITLVGTELSAVIDKGPKQTIQPIDVGNLRVQGQSESPLLNIATDGVKQPQQIQPISNTPQVTAEGLAKNDHFVVNKFQGEIQQFIDGEVKIKSNNLLTSIIKTDSIVESSNSSSSQSPQSSTINTLSMTPTQNTPNASEAKLTSMTMQTPYTPGNKEWSENFARNIALMSVSKNNMAEIRMDPPELGAIQVKISHTGTETNLQFQVNHNDTRQAIEASIQRLKESLAEQGFTNVNVDIQQGEQSQDNDQPTGQSLARSDSNHEDSLPQEQTSILQLQQLPSSGVDFFA